MTRRTYSRRRIPAAFKYCPPRPGARLLDPRAHGGSIRKPESSGRGWGFDIDIPYIPEFLEDIIEDPAEFLIGEAQTFVESGRNLARVPGNIIAGRPASAGFTSSGEHRLGPWALLGAMPLPGEGLVLKGAANLGSAAAQRGARLLGSQFTGKLAPVLGTAAVQTAGRVGAAVGPAVAKSAMELFEYGLTQNLQGTGESTRRIQQASGSTDTDMTMQVGGGAELLKKAGLFWLYQKRNKATGLMYGKLSDGRMVYEKENGTATIYRPKKPIVIGSKMSIPTAARAARKLASYGRQLKKNKAVRQALGL